MQNRGLGSATSGWHAALVPRVHSKLKQPSSVSTNWAPLLLLHLGAEPL